MRKVALCLVESWGFTLGFDEKVRLRSEEELDLQFEGLIRVADILSRHLESWFLSSGTLLGAVRQGDFIPWDWDVCIDVLTEEAQPKFDQICHHLQAEGFVIDKLDTTMKNLKVVASGYGTDYEILGRYLRRGKFRARLMTELPAKLYENSELVKIRGHEFPAPSPAEDLLEALYGDWRTPKRTADKAEYLSPKAYVNRKRKRPKKSGRTPIQRAVNLLLGFSSRGENRHRK